MEWHPNNKINLSIYFRIQEPKCQENELYTNWQSVSDNDRDWPPLFYCSKVFLWCNITSFQYNVLNNNFENILMVTHRSCRRAFFFFLFSFPHIWPVRVSLPLSKRDGFLEFGRFFFLCLQLFWRVGILCHRLILRMGVSCRCLSPFCCSLLFLEEILGDVLTTTSL